MQALWACLDEQMAELTLPFLGASGPAGSTRSATCTAPAPGWSRAATGRSAPPTRSRRSTSAVNRTAYGEPGPRRDRAVPARAGARPRDRVRGVHLRLGVGEPPRRRRACSRPASVADLVVLDRDPFAGPPEEIGAARVVSTWVDGDAGLRRPDDGFRGRNPSRRIAARPLQIPLSSWLGSPSPRIEPGGTGHGWTPDVPERHQRQARRRGVGGDLRRRRPDHGRGLRPRPDVGRGGRRPGVRRRRAGLRGLGRHHPLGAPAGAAQDRRRAREAGRRVRADASPGTPASRSG